MPESQTWRTVLGTLIKDSRYRQKLASELGVHPLTLTRWVEKKSHPRLDSLHRLLSLLPEQRALLLPLIAQEFPEFSTNAAEDEPSEEIPSAFYSKVFNMYSSLPQGQLMWSIYKLILQQARDQLDPQHQSVAILITQCVPPSAGNNVRSLRSTMGLGIAPWGGDLQNQSSFLGADTVPGWVVSSGRPFVVQNYLEPRYAGPESRAGIVSSCTYPLLRANQISGTFGATSILPDYFPPPREKLIQQYANLVSILFAPDAFYPFDEIELRIMPSPLIQLSYLGTFQTRVRRIITEATNNNQSMTSIQAERLVWQQLEEELLQLALLEK